MINKYLVIVTELIQTSGVGLALVVKRVEKTEETVIKGRLKTTLNIVASLTQFHQLSLVVKTLQRRLKTTVMVFLDQLPKTA